MQLWYMVTEALSDENFNRLLAKYKIHKILRHYLANFFLPSDSEYKYLICAIEIAHIVIAFAIAFYIFLPPKLLPYFILFHILVYCHWAFVKDCIITKFTNSLTDNAHARHLPVSWHVIKLYSRAVIAFAIFICVRPQFAPFRLIHWAVNALA